MPLKIVRVYETDETCVEFSDVRRVERLASGAVHLEQCLNADEPGGEVRGVVLPAGTVLEVVTAGVYASLAI